MPVTYEVNFQATVVAPPVYAWNTGMVHRGISLNGMPSYLPPVQAYDIIPVNMYIYIYIYIYI